MSSAPKMSKRRGERLFEAAVRRHFANSIKDADLMVQALVSRAKGGDIPAFTALRDTIDGKPHQSVDIEHDISDEVKTTSNEENLRILRDRLAGILPRRAAAPVEGGGESGSGGDKKPH